MKCVLCGQDVSNPQEIMCEDCLKKPALVRAFQLLAYLNRQAKMSNIKSVDKEM